MSRRSAWPPIDDRPLYISAFTPEEPAGRPAPLWLFLLGCVAAPGGWAAFVYLLFVVGG